MSVLSSILRDIHAKASVYFCDQLIPPWSLKMKDIEYSNFHHVRRGQCIVECDGKREVAGPGDIIFIPNGSDHTLLNVDNYPIGRETEFKTLLLCGYFQFNQELDHPLLSSLPSLVIFRSETLEKNSGLKNTLDLLTHEFTNHQPGSNLLLDKLTEVMLIQLLRSDFPTDIESNFTKALYDKRIGQILTLIHDSPENNWTLESLSTQIGTSRTFLANRFKELVGTTMFSYLTKIRLQRACDLLRSTTLPIYLICEKCGYQSEISFIKTFKQHLSLTPGQYRKKASAAQQP